MEAILVYWKKEILNITFATYAVAKHVTDLNWYFSDTL